MDVNELAKRTIAEQHARIELLERSNAALREETERLRVEIAELKKQRTGNLPE